MGDNFASLASSDEGQKMIRQQALNVLINQALLDQFAQELGISAGDQQIRDAIFLRYLISKLMVNLITKIR